VGVVVVIHKYTFCFLRMGVWEVIARNTEQIPIR
jgi:hypothetical protein